MTKAPFQGSINWWGGGGAVMVGVGVGVVVMVGVGWAVRMVNRKAGQSQVTRQCPERATASHKARTKVNRCGIEPWNLRLLQAATTLPVKRRS